MLEAFQKNLFDLMGNGQRTGNTPLRSDKKFLLAVSGGLDSVVMTELFRRAGYSYSIAHCNFGLRGKESDEDLKFVKTLAVKSKVPFFSVGFDTMSYAGKNKVSVQMAARQLRYEWLEETRQENKSDYVVTAHHADDAIETFFINLLRGTGISGLHGIKTKNENVIRPLLHFYRKDIERFAKRNKLKWREDSSNESDKYERNKIRHHLVPAIEKVDSDAKRRIMDTMILLASTEDVYRRSIKSETERFVKKGKHKTEIELEIFDIQNHAALYLYEIIKEYGFSYEQTLQMEECAKGKKHSGKNFYSYSHRISMDRNKLGIVPHEPEDWQDFTIEKSITLINLGSGIFCFFERFKRTEKFKPQTSNQIASLDFDKLSFPMEVRRWKKGDKFYPFGMNQTKKVSDFLIDNKVSVLDKEKVCVLTSDGKIVWLIGHRIDERFKITEATKNVYICELQKIALP